MTIAAYVEQLVKIYGERTAIIDQGRYRTRKWTYKELHDYAHRITGLFAKKKLKKGDRIIIHAPNSPHWCGLLLACALSGVVAVPLDATYTRDYVERFRRIVKPKLIFTTTRNATKNDIAIENLEYLTKKPYICTARPQTTDLLEIVYTSGTTGNPKGVKITNENIVANIGSLREAWALSSEQVFLSVIPLSHLLEQTVGFFVPMRFGCCTVHPASRRRSDLARAIKETGVSTMVTVPLLLTTIKERIEHQAPMRLYRALLRPFPRRVRRTLARPILNKVAKHLDLFIVGGAPLHTAVEEFWNDLGVHVMQGYGMTEASPIITCNTFKERRAGTVGKALPAQEIRLAPDGEVLAKGKNVFTGYYKNKKATNELLQKGWLHTGDIGNIEDGYLSITGRKKNMLLGPGGENVYPEDIENIIDTQPGIKESCVIGQETGEKTSIVAVILEEEPQDLEALCEHVNKRLARHQQLQRCIKWPDKDFPRTCSLKIKRKDVQERLSGQEVPTETVDDTAALIGRFLKGTVPDHTPLRSQLDSLALLELISALEEHYLVDIDEEQLTPTSTIGELKALIKKGSPHTQELLKGFKRLKRTRRITKPLVDRYTTRAATITIKGIAPTEPCILAPTHTSHLDTLALYQHTPGNIAFAAAQDYFFDNRMKATLLQRLVPIFPFARTGALRPSLRRMGKLLDEGYQVVVYPEGTRSTTGKLGPIKEGIGYIAKELDAPVVPVKIRGTYEIWPKGQRHPKKGHVTIIYGKPIIPTGTPAAITAQVAKALATR